MATTINASKAVASFDANVPIKLAPEQPSGPTQEKLQGDLSSAEADPRIGGSMTGKLGPMGQAALYDEFATEYEEKYDEVGYEGPRVVADSLTNRLPPHLTRVGTKVLDAGCGTGLIGRCLLERGFKWIHGVDISSNMIKYAATAGYASVHVGNLMDRTVFGDGEFDAIVSCGVFTAGHVKPSALDELARITKKGGVMCIGVQEFVYMPDDYPGKVKEMEERGIVKQLAVDTGYTMRKCKTLMYVVVLQRL